MVRDLERAGFQTTVERVLLDGKTYYRVILRQQFQPEEAHNALVRLKEAGFEGAILP